MPFYRFKTGIVHMRGTRLPDPCAAHVLIEGKEVLCASMSAYLCDGLDARNRSHTCDVPLCEAHARQIGPNKHLCPACHQSQLDSEQQRSLFTSIV